MLTSNNSDKRNRAEIASVSKLVPENNLVRKLDDCIDFTLSMT